MTVRLHRFHVGQRVLFNWLGQVHEATVIAASKTNPMVTIKTPDRRVAITVKYTELGVNALERLARET